MILEEILAAPRERAFPRSWVFAHVSDAARGFSVYRANAILFWRRLEILRPPRRPAQTRRLLFLARVQPRVESYARTDAMRDSGCVHVDLYRRRLDVTSILVMEVGILCILMFDELVYGWKVGKVILECRILRDQMD